MPDGHVVSGAHPCDNLKRAHALLGALFSRSAVAVPKGCTSGWFLGAGMRALCSGEAAQHC